VSSRRGFRARAIYANQAFLLITTHPRGPPSLVTAIPTDRNELAVSRINLCCHLQQELRLLTSNRRNLLQLQSNKCPRAALFERNTLPAFSGLRHDTDTRGIASRRQTWGTDTIHSYKKICISVSALLRNNTNNCMWGHHQQQLELLATGPYCGLKVSRFTTTFQHERMHVCMLRYKFGGTSTRAYMRTSINVNRSKVGPHAIIIKPDAGKGKGEATSQHHDHRGGSKPCIKCALRSDADLGGSCEQVAIAL